MAAEADLLASFWFGVRITGQGRSVDAAFQEVSGLSQEMAVEEVVSGGENRFGYRLPGRTRYPNLVLKRGVASSESPLVEWCQGTLDGGLGRPIQTKNLSVNLFDASGQPKLSWTFVKAYPVKWTMSELSAQDNRLLIETIELAYLYFEADDARTDQYADVASLFKGA